MTGINYAGISLVSCKIDYMDRDKFQHTLKTHSVTDQCNIIADDQRHIMERMDVMLNIHYATNCFSVFSYTAVNVMASR